MSDKEKEIYSYYISEYAGRVAVYELSKEINFTSTFTSFSGKDGYDGIILSGNNEYLTEIKMRDYNLTNRFINEGAIMEKYKVNNLQLSATNRNSKAYIINIWKPNVVTIWDITNSKNIKTGNKKRNDTNSTHRYYSTATTSSEHYLLNVHESQIYKSKILNLYNYAIEKAKSVISIRFDNPDIKNIDITKYKYKSCN